MKQIQQRCDYKSEKGEGEQSAPLLIFFEKGAIEMDENTQLIIEWKKTYGDSVYAIEILDIEFVFRGLSYAEFTEIDRYIEDPYEKSEELCRKCVLHPEVTDWSDDIYGGIPETLAEEILKMSGYSDQYDKLREEEAKNDAEMTLMIHQMPCIIKEVFSEYHIEEITSWPFDKLIWHYSRAKWTLENLRGVRLEEDSGGVPPADI